MLADLINALPGLIRTLQRNILVMVLALATAMIISSGMDKLISWPTDGITIPEPGAIPGITICDTLPSGDISSCRIQ